MNAELVLYSSAYSNYTLLLGSLFAFSGFLFFAGFPFTLISFALLASRYALILLLQKC